MVRELKETDDWFRTRLMEECKLCLRELLIASLLVKIVFITRIFAYRTFREFFQNCVCVCSDILYITSCNFV